MYKIYATIVALLLSMIVFAQSPEKMSYQAVIRNTENNLVKSQQVGMQISILQNSTDGNVVYTETQAPVTNENGLVSVEIGTGNSVDDFSTIDWANGTYFIKCETDIEGGTNYTITGVSQLLSVPYALYAKEAEKSSCVSVKTVEVFNGNSSKGWTELDLSDAVGNNYAIVTLKVKNQSSTNGILSIFRQKGDTDDYMIGSDTDNMVSLGYSGIGQAIVYTNKDGIIEWKSNEINPVKIEVVAFTR